MSVFGSGGKLVVFLLWREIFITTGKKRYSRLSGGLYCCDSFWFWQEISIFFVVAGNFDYDWKKKDTVVCWREIGSYFVVAGNFHYDRKKKRYITTGKKRYSRLSNGCAVLAITTGKKDTVVCLTGCAVVLFFVVAGNFDYDRKKKIQLSVFAS